MENVIPSRLSVLGHPQRLAIFRLLMRRYPDRVPAGELAEALDLKASTLSAYLAALQQVGLVSQERVGTSLRYQIVKTEVRRIFDYLLLDCCRGRPEFCSPVSFPFAPGNQPMTDQKYKVLFICTGNSARSIFAESILRKEAGDRFEVYSAGTKPRSELNPFALDVLQQKGHDISVLRAKNIAEFHMTVYALNGLGRIGKLALKPLLERGAQIAWINDAVGDPAMHAHLLEFDTVHGRWDAAFSPMTPTA
jgi:DNA-binding transcriptional ArsR family regulator